MSTAVALIRDPGGAASALHPLRSRILDALRDPDSATGVARRLGLPRQRVGYHVRELERRGLLRHIEDRRKGNCTERVLQATARHYLIDPAALGGAGLDPAAVQDRFSSTYLVAASARTAGTVTRLQQLAELSGKRLTTLTLESEVRFATPDDQHAFAEELADLVAGLVARYDRPETGTGRSFRLLAVSHPVSATLRADAGAEPVGASAGSSQVAHTDEDGMETDAG